MKTPLLMNAFAIMAGLIITVIGGGLLYASVSEIHKQHPITLVVVFFSGLALSYLGIYVMYRAAYDSPTDN